VLGAVLAGGLRGAAGRSADRLGRRRRRPAIVALVSLLYGPYDW
jgi:hypothetical protein